MTWVCAASTIFGYGALYSDIQVTFPDGQTMDLLQKAYPVGNFIAAGFAGSVRIGFKLLQSLTEFLALTKKDTQTLAWDPPWVSSQWAPIAWSIFNSERVQEKLRGSQILMVGASPTEPCWLGARIYFTRLVAPDFRPCLMSRAIKFCSIGSGAAISEYKHHLKPHFRLASRIHRAEVGNPGGWARMLGFSISRALVDNPRTGISRHLHILIVQRGSISVENNDENVYRGQDLVEVRMPSVARSYADFVEKATCSGHDAAGAVC